LRGDLILIGQAGIGLPIGKQQDPRQGLGPYLSRHLLRALQPAAMQMGAATRGDRL